MEQLEILQQEMGKVREKVHSLSGEVTAIKLNYASHVCNKEQDWGKLWEILKTCTDHVISGDSVGGFRDRVLLLEQSISELKKAMWVRVVVSGFIGGLLGTGSSDAIGMVIKWVMGR